MEEKILKHLLAQFGEEIATNTSALQQGAAKTFDEYKHLCGVIRGLSLAQSHVTDLMRRLEHFDD
jgi:hypothetical protein